jgi:hypothetical protein
LNPYKSKNLQTAAIAATILISAAAMLVVVNLTSANPVMQPNSFNLYKSPDEELHDLANPEIQEVKNEEPIPTWAYIAFFIGIGVSVGAVAAVIKLSRRKP